MRRLGYFAFGLLVVVGGAFVSWSSPAVSQDRSESQFQSLNEFDRSELLGRDDLVDCAPDLPGVVGTSAVVHEITERQATLAFERPGLVKEVRVRAGDVVVKGDLLASLNDEAAVAADRIAQLEARNDVDIRYAIKARDVAQAEYDSAINANRGLPNTIVKNQILQLKLAVERSALQIEQAEHQAEANKLTAEESKAQLKSFSMKAPFGGTVVEVHKSAGEAVTQGDPVIRIVNLEKVKVQSEIGIADLRKVKVGDRTVVRLKLHPDTAPFEDEDQLLDGKVVFISLKADGLDKVVIWSEITNKDNFLLPGNQIHIKYVAGAR